MDRRLSCHFVIPLLNRLCAPDLSSLYSCMEKTRNCLDRRPYCPPQHKKKSRYLSPNLSYSIPRAACPTSVISAASMNIIPPRKSTQYQRYSEPDFNKKYAKSGQRGPNLDIVEFSAPCRKHKDYNKEHSEPYLEVVSSGNEFDPTLRYRDSLPKCAYSSHDILSGKRRSSPQRSPLYRERTLPRDDQYRAEVITKNPKSPPKVSISSPLEKIEVDRCQVCQGLNYERPSGHRSKEDGETDLCKSGNDGCLICYKYFAVFKSESST